MDLTLITPELLFLLFLVALVAGALDTLAGGGGLIVLPALILAGFPPLLALGTNKMQGAMGTATATFMMLKHKRISWQQCRMPMLFAFIGSALGSTLVQWLDTGFLRSLIPIVLAGIAVYFLLAGTLLDVVHPVKISASLYRRIALPIIGFYDGMFGPGTGSFFSLAGVALQGNTLLQATAMAKSLNFATNLASLLIFLGLGKVVWQAGVVMMLGQICGAWAGSHLLFRIKPLWLRLLIVAMCAAMLVRYFS